MVKRRMSLQSKHDQDEMDDEDENGDMDDDKDTASTTDDEDRGSFVSRFIHRIFGGDDNRKGGIGEEVSIVAKNQHDMSSSSASSTAEGSSTLTVTANPNDRNSIEVAFNAFFNWFVQLFHQNP